MRSSSKWVRGLGAFRKKDQGADEEKQELKLSQRKNNKVDNRSVAQRIRDSFIENPNYIDEVTGKNSLHLFIDYACSSTFSLRNFDISETIKSICTSNPRALLQLEYKNRYDPLAYLLAHPSIRLRTKGIIMFELLGCGASLEYVTRFEDVKNSLNKLFLSEWVMDSALNKVRTAIHIGKGAQRIGALSRTLPSHLTNLVAKSGSLQPKDFEVCIKKIIEEQSQAAKKQKKANSSSWGFGSYSYVYPFSETEEQRIHAELEKKIAKENTLVSANSFFEREITALYKICKPQSESKEGKEEANTQASAAMIWLAGLNVRQGLNTLQFLEKEQKLNSEAVYLVDRLLRAGLFFETMRHGEDTPLSIL